MNFYSKHLLSKNEASSQTAEACIRSYKYYVYILCDECGTPFYVGKGSGQRISAHERHAKNGRKNYRCNVIREIWRRGFDVKYVLSGFFVDENFAFEHEKDLISLYGRRDLGTGILTNVTEGGEGCAHMGAMRENHLAAVKKFTSDPEWLERTAERNREIAKTEQWQARRREGIERMKNDPAWRAANKAAAEKRRNDPVWRAAHLERVRRPLTPERRAAVTERNRSPEMRAFKSAVALERHSETGGMRLECLVLMSVYDLNHTLPHGNSGVEKWSSALHEVRCMAFPSYGM